MSDWSELLSHLATAVGGAGTVGAFLRFRQNSNKARIDRVEKLEKKVDEYVDKIGSLKTSVAELNGHSLLMEERLQESDRKCQKAREEDAKKCQEDTQKAVQEAEARLLRNMDRTVKRVVKRTLSPTSMPAAEEAEDEEG